MLRARIGTAMSECTPYSRIFAVRSGSWVAHRASEGSRTGMSSGSPSISRFASCGGGTKSTASPTWATASGAPSRTERIAARHIRGRAGAGPASGSQAPWPSVLSTGSSRSTTTKSAKRGTAKSASSCAVAPTSSVRPMAVPASLTRVSSWRACQRSVTSWTM